MLHLGYCISHLHQVQSDGSGGHPSARVSWSNRTTNGRPCSLPMTKLNLRTGSLWLTSVASCLVKHSKPLSYLSLEARLLILEKERELYNSDT